MYVILEAGGKQYTLEKNSEFLVDRIQQKVASLVKLKDVLFAREKASYYIGNPYLKDAYVTCEVLSHPRSRKVIAFKYKRRKSQKRKVGHRQNLTRLRVKEIKL